MFESTEFDLQQFAASPLDGDLTELIADIYRRPETLKFLAEDEVATRMHQMIQFTFDFDDWGFVSHYKRRLAFDLCW